MEKKTNSNYSEMLRMENELTRMKIKAEFGVEINKMEGMSPALESHWLNQIIEIEKTKASEKMTTIGEILGNPEYLPVEVISDEEISDELQSLMEKMRRKNVVVDCEPDVDDREMYRFLTEELFKKEVEAGMPHGMVYFTSYEEFHPGSENFIRKQATDFIYCMIEEEFVLYYCFFGLDEERSEELMIFLDNLVRKCEKFRDAFDHRKVEDCSIIKVEINGDRAEVPFDFSIVVRPEENKYNHEISGRGLVSFECKEGVWMIVNLAMPGVV